MEDLFDLSTRDLDSIFKVLNAQLKQTKEESLLDVKTKQDEELEVKIEIIKYVVKNKQEEAGLKIKAKEQKEERQRILEVLASKQVESLKSKTAKELKNY